MERMITFAARWLIGLGSIGIGLLFIITWDQKLAYYAKTPIYGLVGQQFLPTVLVVLIVIKVVGGLFIALNFKSKAAAAAIALSIAFTMLFLHQENLVNNSLSPDTYRDFLLEAQLLGSMLFVMLAGPSVQASARR